MVYALGQRHLQQVLAQNYETVLDRKNDPHQHSRYAGSSYCFQAIHLACLNGLDRYTLKLIFHTNVMDFSAESLANLNA